MRYGLLLWALFVLLHAASAQLPAGFRPLFNGKDLTGWHFSRTTHQGTMGKAVVEDGALVLRQNPYGQGGVLLTDRKYRDFELYLEAKVDSFCNGGIFLRSSEGGAGYQVELSMPGGHADLLGERLAISQPAKATRIREVWKPGDWNSLRIRMEGEVPTLTLWVNGEKMWEVTQPKNDFYAGATEGRIGLQLHWSAVYSPAAKPFFDMAASWRPGGAHRFRNIAIRELPGR